MFSTLGLLSIGALIGWFIHQLLDIAFWRNRRICTESEVAMQQQIKQYEAERQSNQTLLADYQDRLSLYEKNGAPTGDGTITYDQSVEYDYDEPETADYDPDAPDMDVASNTDLDLPRVDFTPPNLDADIPQVDAPDIDLSDVDIPDVEVAEVTMPDLDMPNMGAKAGLVGAAGLATQIDMPSAPEAPDLELDLPELNTNADVDAVTDIDINADVDRVEDVEGTRVGGADDLKIIWGIGPAVEELLNDNGIATFAELASTSIGELSGILNAGGDRFNMLQPYTWPDQARLANDGNWQTLEKLQSELG